MKRWGLHEITIKLIAALISAALWLTFGTINLLTTPLTQHTPGIDLIYLPAGLRLIILLVAGMWGATGIAIASPIFLLVQQGDGAVADFIYGVLNGFVPLVTILIVKSAFSIRERLQDIKAQQLIILALSVSIVTPLFINAFLLAFHFKPTSEFWANSSSMMLGDLLGCAIVLIVMKICFYIYKKAEAQGMI